MGRGILWLRLSDHPWRVCPIMVTTREAIQRVIEETGLPDSVVSYAARYLADAGRWPKGKRGGRGVNAAHVTTGDLTNLLLAVCAADELKRSPEAVVEFRGMRLGGPVRRSHLVRSSMGLTGGRSVVEHSWTIRSDDAPRLSGLLSRQIFGHVVELLIRDATEYPEQLAETLGRVTLDLTRRGATVELIEPVHDESGNVQAETVTLNFKGDGREVNPAHPPVLREIPLETFLAFGAIARDAEISEGDGPLFDDAGAPADSDSGKEETRTAPTVRASEEPNGRQDRHAKGSSLHAQDSVSGDGDQDDSDSLPESAGGSSTAKPPRPRLRRYDDREPNSADRAVA